MNRKGFLVILSAPSGCGKDTIFRGICDIRNDCIESISATTRSMRCGEVEGVNYFFKSLEEFEDMIAGNQLLEYAEYNGNYYGTPIFGVEKAIEEGKICFLIIEVQGAQNVMKLCPDAVSIFLLPPSIEELERRLLKRGTDDAEDVKKRIEIARHEMELSHLYKYVVVNDAVESAVDKVNNILNNELFARNESGVLV